MPSTRKTWILVASLIAIILVALTWMFLLSPVREKTGTLNDEAEGVEAANEILDAKVSKLRSQYAKIDEFRALLTEFEQHIPAAVDYQSITAEIDRSVEKSGVALLSVESGESVAPVVPFTAAQPTTAAASADPNAPVADEQKPAAASANPGTPATKTGALAKVLPGFFQLPLVITVQGDYAEVRDFVDTLQVDSTRSLLVPSITAVSLKEAPESDKAPKAEVGDITFTVNALAYVLEYDRSVLLAPGQTDPSAESEQVMPPAATDNIFAPERD
ncbi:hypothetical protein [Timonella sp. A28]|uniref:hypothetical protein n=1 Tax=Timonella sp. A28 TaxID=3442640 RepID=UPI003EBF0C17